MILITDRRQGVDCPLCEKGELHTHDPNYLELHGHATNQIWLMEDGPESHPIGIRLDCGDSGVVFLSKNQAKDLAEQLTAFVK